LLLSGDKTKESAILALSNDFYTKLPHNFGLKAPTKIDHLLRIKDKLRLLETLSSIQSTQSLFCQHELELSLCHPLDLYYQLLCCNLSPLPFDDPLTDLLTQSFLNTHADSHQSFTLDLAAIFTVTKASERLRYLPFEQTLHNKFMLWYPVAQTALARVLREGVKMPGEEVPAETFRYGKGIYFYDCASKAVHTSPPRGEVGYMVLCEVALGEMHQTSKSY
jgi:poly [ADP-ribose] polymerase